MGELLILLLLSVVSFQEELPLNVSSMLSLGPQDVELTISKLINKE